jgi:hypothetical protein
VNFGKGIKIAVEEIGGGHRSLFSFFPEVAAK